jgi:hypothetical protein
MLTSNVIMAREAIIYQVLLLVHRADGFTNFMCRMPRNSGNMNPLEN